MTVRNFNNCSEWLSFCLTACFIESGIEQGNFFEHWYFRR